MLKKIILGLLVLVGVFFSTVDVHAVAEGQINKPDFKINTSTISPGGNNLGITTSDDIGETANSILAKIIENLIVVFGVLSLLVMTIGAGYMIFYSGVDSLLSRGKTIFIWGLVSLAIALSAGIIVKIVTYLLYNAG